jgi:hypothetical protein
VKTIRLVSAILLFALPILASVDAEDELSFQGRTYGPRSAAMADAATSSADDASAVFVNPALLSLSRGSGIFVSHLETPGDIATEFVSYNHRLFRGTLAWSLLYHHTADIPVLSGFKPTGETMAYRNIAGLLSYGRNVWSWKNLTTAAGATFRYATAERPDSRPRAFLFDLGLLGRYSLDELLPNFDELKLGLGFLDILPGFAYANKARRTDFLFRAGLSSGYKRIVSCAIDLTASADQGARCSFGAEFFPVHFLALRAGYILGREGGGFTAGCGIGSRLHRGGLSFELGISPDVARPVLIETAVHWTFSGPYRYLTVKEIIVQEKSAQEEAARREEARARKKAEAAERKLKRTQEQSEPVPAVEPAPSAPAPIEESPTPAPPAPSSETQQNGVEKGSGSTGDSSNPYSPDYQLPTIPTIDDGKEGGK